MPYGFHPFIDGHHGYYNFGQIYRRPLIQKDSIGALITIYIITKEI
jgi:hypothetical protein